MTGYRAKNLLVAGTVALVALTACTGRTEPRSGVAASSAPAPADTVDRALADLERFWTATFPTISEGKPFQPIQGGFHPYTQADPPPPCGKEAGEYQPNAVAGMLQLRDQPGTSATSEGAHGNAFDRIRALQDGMQNGATKCGYREGNLPITEVPFTEERDAATGGNLPYDEAVDLLVNDAAEYWSRAYPQITGQPWKDLTVKPFDPASPPACADPDAIADGAAFYCPEVEFIAFSEQLGRTLYERAGDNAVGMLVGDLYARAAQHRRGQSTQGDSGQLTVDCLNGSWTYDLLHRDARSQTTKLSPGDLDEAVAALLAFGRATAGTGPSGFDRIAAYRNGVLKGLSACG